MIAAWWSSVLDLLPPIGLGVVLICATVAFVARRSL